jgi:hypothetical protein
MNDTVPEKTVTLVIGRAEALILFELLFDFRKQPALEINDAAERLALMRLHGALESTLVDLFAVDYEGIIGAARNDLLRQWRDEPLSQS